MCFIKVVIQRQWCGYRERQTTHKAVIVLPCAMPCTTLHWRLRGLLCFGRSHHLSAVVSQSHHYEQNKVRELCLQFLLQNSISALGAVEEKEKGYCRHEERDMSWNVVGFTKHKKEYRNHQEASLNCGKKDKPLLSRPRTKCNTFDKGSQSVGMEQHWGCQARCPLLVVTPELFSCQAEKGQISPLKRGFCAYRNLSLPLPSTEKLGHSKTPNISLAYLGWMSEVLNKVGWWAGLPKGWERWGWGGLHLLCRPSLRWVQPHCNTASKVFRREQLFLCRCTSENCDWAGQRVCQRAILDSAYWCDEVEISIFSVRCL